MKRWEYYCNETVKRLQERDVENFKLVLETGLCKSKGLINCKFCPFENKQCKKARNDKINLAQEDKDRLLEEFICNMITMNYESWKKSAESGDCRRNLSCNFCPLIDTQECCDKDWGEETSKFLNEEVKDEVLGRIE